MNRFECPLDQKVLECMGPNEEEPTKRDEETLEWWHEDPDDSGPIAIHEEENQIFEDSQSLPMSLNSLESTGSTGSTCFYHKGKPYIDFIHKYSVRISSIRNISKPNGLIQLIHEPSSLESPWVFLYIHFLLNFSGFNPKYSSHFRMETAKFVSLSNFL